MFLGFGFKGKRHENPALPGCRAPLQDAGGGPYGAARASFRLRPHGNPSEMGRLVGFWSWYPFLLNGNQEKNRKGSDSRNMTLRWSFVLGYAHVDPGKCLLCACQFRGKPGGLPAKDHFYMFLNTLLLMLLNITPCSCHLEASFLWTVPCIMANITCCRSFAKLLGG